MIREIKKYQRQVKKHLCCPRTLRKAFLSQLEDDLLLYCEDKANIDYEQLVERFGQPKYVAETFFADMDARVVSRFAYTRLKIVYIAISITLLFALSAISIEVFDYSQARQLVSDSRLVESITHNDGSNCTSFWVRTESNRKEQYWEYHSCENFWQRIPKPKESTGMEALAVEIYTNSNDTVTHWKYDSERNYWIAVSNDG